MIVGYSDQDHSSLLPMGSPPFKYYKVEDLIDHNNGWCHKELISHIFLPCVAELIMSIPLCAPWPFDKLIWHYDSHDLFTVCSVYHMLVWWHPWQLEFLLSWQSTLVIYLELQCPPSIKLFDGEPMLEHSPLFWIKKWTTAGKWVGLDPSI